MNEEREQKSSVSGWLWVILAVPLVYVLSIGPVAAIAERSGGPPSGVRQVYAPLKWLYDHTFLRKPLEAYLKLWGVY